MSKRKNARRSESGTNDAETSYSEEKYLSPEEMALLSLPEHLRISSSNRSEEMLSNQMLNGIPEVDLGIDAKIRNIEATEAAKEKLVLDQKNKKDAPSQFVPTNMAVNFVQHNRCKYPSDFFVQNEFRIDSTCDISVNIEDSESKRRKQRQHEQQNDRPQGVKRATDDYHYDKFKKQYRRY